MVSGVIGIITNYPATIVTVDVETAGFGVRPLPRYRVGCTYHVSTRVTPRQLRIPGVDQMESDVRREVFCNPLTALRTSPVYGSGAAFLGMSPDSVNTTPSPSRNLIDCGDNLQRLARLAPESVDLIYLDPPFFSNKKYEVIWGDEAEIRSFEDRWEGGINVYIDWMRDRIDEMHRVLKPTGSLYLHCDWHASHYLKVMLDGIFKPQNF